MEYSKNKMVNMVLKFIGPEYFNEMEEFINNVLQTRFVTFNDDVSLNKFFSEYLEKFYSTHNEDEIRSLRTYTGYEFSNINSILRNNWNYEINGLLTQEKANYLLAFASHLSAMINSLENIPCNIKSYRGVTLNSFKSYGITSIEELGTLKGQYLYEEGFTSTSLIRDRSFFDRELEYHEKCNIEMEYLIPEETNEVIPLISDDLSYSKVQSELLINCESLSKVIDVVISEDKTKAYIKVVLVPRKIYDKNISDKQINSPSIN